MLIRHGDVLLEEVNAIPEGAKKLNRNWLFQGEATGHAHRIDVGEIFETIDGDLYLRADKLTNLTHEEHQTVPLIRKIYLIGQKRQYVPDGGWERVVD